MNDGTAERTHGNGGNGGHGNRQVRVRMLVESKAAQEARFKAVRAMSTLQAQDARKPGERRREQSGAEDDDSAAAAVNKCSLFRRNETRRCTPHPRAFADLRMKRVATTLYKSTTVKSATVKGAGEGGIAERTVANTVATQDAGQAVTVPYVLELAHPLHQPDQVTCEPHSVVRTLIAALYVLILH